MLTTAVLLEYESVLKRPEQIEQHRLLTRDIDQALNTLASLAVRVTIRYQYRPQLVDPDDEHVLEAAVNGFANALVTNNVRGFLSAAFGFSLQVLRPANVISLGRSV